MSQQQPQTDRRTVSETVTITAPPVLRLEADQQSRQEVTWDESVIDNENLNRRKTKICCIFHPTDEDGSRECDSDSDSSSDSSGDESDKPKKENPDKKNKNDDCRKSKPNAYEVQPTYTNRSQVPKKL